jgi:hypothetical protein
MKKLSHLAFILIAIVCLTGCGLFPTPAPQQATVVVNLDLGTGGSGFAATLYAQEVASGKTFHGNYSAGSHGLIIAPTSAPVPILVDAPGTYIFYAINNEAPDDYHWGDTGCKPASDCLTSELVALDVVPDQTYYVTITDRAALLPTQNAPVTVPWHR